MSVAVAGEGGGLWRSGDTLHESVLLSGAGIELVARFGSWWFYLLRRFSVLPFLCHVYVFVEGINESSFENHKK